MLLDKIFLDLGFISISESENVYCMYDSFISFKCTSVPGIYNIELTRDGIKYVYQVNTRLESDMISFIVYLINFYRL